MEHLRLTPEEVATERQVILEERRSRIDNNPTALLDEQMNATLYLSHPYGIPVIGWEHEMAKLSREDALRFYKHYYAPNNAILVVAGDVTPEEVKRLAEETYGKVPANPEVGVRKRPEEPPHIASRRLELKDPRAGNASFHRYYVAPSYSTAKPGEAEALDLLMKILADGSTSRLYRKLVVEDKIAATTGGDYSGWGLDGGAVSLYAVAGGGNGLDKIEASVDGVLDDIRANGVTEVELARAKKSLLADYIYESGAEYRSLEQSGAEQIAGSSGLARELQHLRDDIEVAQYISPDETNAYETNIAQLANKIENERTSLDQFENGYRRNYTLGMAIPGDSIARHRIARS